MYFGVILFAILGAFIGVCISFLCITTGEIEMTGRRMLIIVIIGAVLGGLCGDSMDKTTGARATVKYLQEHDGNTPSHKGEKKCGYCGNWYSDESNKNSIARTHLCTKCNSNREGMSKFIEDNK